MSNPKVDLLDRQAILYRPPDRNHYRMKEDTAYPAFDGTCVVYSDNEQPTQEQLLAADTSKLDSFTLWEQVGSTLPGVDYLTVRKQLLKILLIVGFEGLSAVDQGKCVEYFILPFEIRRHLKSKSELIRLGAEFNAQAIAARAIRYKAGHSLILNTLNLSDAKEVGRTLQFHDLPNAYIEQGLKGKGFDDESDKDTEGLFNYFDATANGMFADIGLRAQKYQPQYLDETLDDLVDELITLGDENIVTYKAEVPA